MTFRLHPQKRDIFDMFNMLTCSKIKKHVNLLVYVNDHGSSHENKLCGEHKCLCPDLY